MEKGDLIRRQTDRAKGIVISVHGVEAEVLFGNGLREIVAVNLLREIEFKPNTQIPACFVELVNAYITCRGFE